MCRRPCVLYDVTRLLARRNEETPTGIDRVDLHYAIYFLESDNYDTVFVHKNGGRAFLAETAIISRLVRALEQRWLKPTPSQEFESLTHNYHQYFGTKICQILRNLFVKMPANPCGVMTKKHIKAVDIKLFEFLLENRERKIVYCNCHHGVGALATYNLFKAVANVKIVFYLHDLIPIDYPQFFRKDVDKAHTRRVSAMARYGDLVLANSNYTKRRFEDFCRKNGLRQPKTKTLIIGTEEYFFANAKALRSADSQGLLALERPYFVVISTIEPRKNHLLLLKVWQRLSEELGEDCPKLVILGKRGWSNQHVFDLLDRCEVIADSVLELNGLNDRHLIRLLVQSRALLSPSFVEGWGMPIAEAMTLGVPVICSDIPAHRESAQECAEFLDPLDETAWHRAVLRLIEDDGAVEAARARQAGYAPASWDEHFRLLEAELEGLLKNGEPRTPVDHLTGGGRPPLRHEGDRAQVPDTL